MARCFVAVTAADGSRVFVNPSTVAFLAPNQSGDWTVVFTNGKELVIRDKGRKAIAGVPFEWRDAPDP